MTDAPQFTVGQEVKITGGKHQKALKDGDKCLISSIKSTFCEVSVFGNGETEPKQIQCHRKFLEGVDGTNPPPAGDMVDPVPAEEETGDAGVKFEMPAAEDCVAVTEEQMETINQSGATSEVEAVVQEVIQDVVDSAVETGDELQMLRQRVKDLEADCESYRDMMLGHQNELQYLRTQTGPSIEEKKVRNEKILQCINILCQLQQ
jgi:hypothetical protein